MADAVREQLVTEALGLTFDQLDEETVHAAVVRFVDTVGALLGGFDGEPCQIARNLAAEYRTTSGATVLGTELRTAPDLAAFANSTAARYAEMNDVYHAPGSAGGHPSDVIMPVLAAAEYARTDGRTLLTGIVLAYETYLRLSDVMKDTGFDTATYAAIGAALGASKVMGLGREQMQDAVSLAAIPNNALRQSRQGHLSMWKAAAAGQAARAGVFAAVLAKAGMTAPAEPFEGNDGWLEVVARKRIDVAKLGNPYKIKETLLKPRASCATTISSILAAEKAYEQAAGKLKIKSVLVETYGPAKRGMATGEHHWHPTTRETADHSIPYVVAATLLDGTVGPDQFDQKHRTNRQLQDILARVEVVENQEFTQSYEHHPVQHRTRVTIHTVDNRTITGESGGKNGDLSNPMTDKEVTEKFTQAATKRYGEPQRTKISQALWAIANINDVAQLPKMLTQEN